MSPRYQAPDEGWSQNRQRGLGLFYDQHRCEQFPDGRPWWCWTERPADGAHMPRSIGDMIPHGWNAPWVPDSHYLITAYETLETNRFTIRYDMIITEYRTAMEDFYQRAAQEAASFNLPIPDYGEALGWKLRQIVGKPPRSPKIPEAARAGDRWILGLRNEPNEYLLRLLKTGDLRISAGESRQEYPIEYIINRTSMPTPEEEQYFTDDPRDGKSIEEQREELRTKIEREREAQAAARHRAVAKGKAILEAKDAAILNQPIG